MSFALCVMGVVVLFFAGCDKRSDEAAVPSSSPESYMNDKAFRSKLDSMRKEREGLAQVRVKLIKELKAKVDAVRVKNPKADDAALKALLAKDAEYVSLEKRVADLGTAIEENRLQATKIVGRRIAPARSGKDSASPLRSGKDSASPLRSGKDSGRAAPIADAIAPLAKEISK